MNYAVDQINGNIAVLENIMSGEKIEIDVSSLPKNIKEGSLLLLQNNKYILNKTLEKSRREMLQNKLNRLKMRR